MTPPAGTVLQIPTPLHTCYRILNETRVEPERDVVGGVRPAGNGAASGRVSTGDDEEAVLFDLSRKRRYQDLLFVTVEPRANVKLLVDAVMIDRWICNEDGAMSS